MEERESRRWWAVDTDGWRVQNVTGFICPENPGYWWVPELRYSMCEGYSLFPTEAEALDRAIEMLQGVMKVHRQHLRAMQVQRRSAAPPEAAP